MAKKRVGPREKAYLAAEDATEFCAMLYGWTLYGRRLVKARSRDEPHQRLLYLTATAMFRTVQRLVPDRRWRKLLDTAEAYAEGTATVNQLIAATEAGQVNADHRPAANAAASACVSMMSDDDKAVEGIYQVIDAAGYLGAVKAGVLGKDTRRDAAKDVWREPAFADARDAHNRMLCSLIRDIFGNPFRPVVADPKWLTPTAVGLANAIYVEKAFDRLPVLADALEEAGCDDATLLGHCRGPGPHVRGCWAVDLVLGRE